LNLYFFMWSGKKFSKNKQKIFDCFEKKKKTEKEKQKNTFL